MAEAPLLTPDEYFLDVNVARALVAAFETVTQVWRYPEDEAIRCRPVTAPRTQPGGLLATFDLFLPDGRSAEVDMAGRKPKAGEPLVWCLNEARFFLPCQCGRVHHVATIGEDGEAHHLAIDCVELAPVELPSR